MSVCYLVRIINASVNFKEAATLTSGEVGGSGSTLGQVPHGVHLHRVVGRRRQRAHVKVHHVSRHTFHHRSHWKDTSREALQQHITIQNVESRRQDVKDEASF